MIPNVKDRELESNGVEAVGAFGISQDDTAHIMTILRSTLYSDKTLAVLREYGSNAWDAHRSVGKDNVPISVTLPTESEPTLAIRDFGPGLSHADVFNIYTQYGKSTKRQDDNSVGMLGIGSKSGFAYTDSFTITSWHKGTKRIYVAVLDKSEKGLINLMHEEPCGEEETGIEIQIAVQQDDISEFTQKAEKLFQHFNPRPKINIDLKALPDNITVLKEGYIFHKKDDDSYYENSWTAVMGCVPYRININQLRKDYKEFPYLNQMSGVLNFNIGEVHINASREELKYSTETKAAIVAKITNLVDEFVKHTLNEIQNGTKTPWERRLKAQVFRKFHLPIPSHAKEITDQFVEILNGPASFQITAKKKREAAKHIQVHEDTKVYLRDDTRAVKGYELDDHDVIVRRKKGTLDQVEKDLAAFFDKLLLTGIPITKLSSVPWYGDAKSPRAASSTPHYKYKIFEFLPNERYRDKNLSANWKIVENRTPTPDDVYVVLQRFEAMDGNFYSRYKNDEQLMQGLGKTMPTVYGYRDTDTSPVKTAELVGTIYADWRTKNVTQLFDEFKADMHEFAWANAIRYVNKNILTTLATELGDSHIIIEAFNRQLSAEKTIQKFNPDMKNSLENLYRQCQDIMEKDTTFEPTTKLNALKTRYPLVHLNEYDDYSGFRKLWSSDASEWIKYVKMVDIVNP